MDNDYYYYDICIYTILDIVYWSIMIIVIMIIDIWQP